MSDRSSSFEMLWDCPFCGQKKLLGFTHRHCPSCGAAQEPSNRYFPAPGEEVEATNHEFAGVDRICPSCSSPNGAKAFYCGNCGGGLDGAAAVKLKMDHLFAAGEAPADGAPLPPSAVEQPPLTLASEPPRHRRWLWLTLAALVLGGGFFWLFKHEKTLQVVGHAWARDIEVDEFYAAQESKDCDLMPIGGELHSRSTEVRTRRVPAGEDCHDVCRDQRQDRGDGTFAKTKSCQKQCKPRYTSQVYTVTVCRFSLGKWRRARQVHAGQPGLALPEAWPAVTLKTSTHPKNYGAEREAKRTESYQLKVKDAKGKIFSCNLPQEAPWREIKDGDRVLLAFNALGKPKCATLKRKP